jgi:hypothetical protein
MGKYRLDCMPSLYVSLTNTLAPQTSTTTAVKYHPNFAHQNRQVQ